MEYSVTEFTPWAGLIGGMLIGLASLLMLMMTGKIAGISGIAAGLMSSKAGAVGWRAAFVIGLIIGGLIYVPLTGNSIGVNLQVGWGWMLVGGFLVGFGTRMGSGCTSGHGVSGISRMSARSLAATATFLATALVTVYLARHVVGI